ncbi:hypothetical protein ACI2VK_25245 [Ralstonia nicotianae]|nr:hypothetical protein [Ralstonia solanacearum]
MDEKTPWEQAAAVEGTTDSERALTQLARKAFLSLWSYSNVFTDEGRANGRGDGKELCDLLVVFGNDVLLFSDKACEYHLDTDVKVAWPRWYKRAIEKSVRQLAGAEKFLKAFPKRIFLDKQCQTPLPVPLPEAAVARYFLIAVTRGAHLAARQFFGGGSSGSVMLCSDIRGKEHYEVPFQIGFPLESGRFVHVLDEMTVDLLLEELDTVPDLVAYLACKEAFISKPGVLVSIPGEEEILARYMATMRDGQHALPEIQGEMIYAALPEGDWEAYAKSAQRAAKREADKVSYLWDALIEHQSNFIRAGTAITLTDQSPQQVEHERIVRAMAQQNRLARRQCGADLHYVLSQDEPGGVFTRIHMNGAPPKRAFVFLAAKRQADMSYEDYRESRMHYLMTYCHAIKGDMPTLQEAIGVSAEPFSEGESSFEFLYVDHSASMSDEEKNAWRDMADELEILRPKTQFAFYKNAAKEFPIPFNFGSEHHEPFMSRAERRRTEREARKMAKRKRR